ncbi:MAG TPA: tetratricopeptide repeat protein [Candidatus Krumholzibacteria bacterium]|nr:tetratricopeptide repeat protein [Candidatus Krumholzibacteria bacterium]HPD71824.1 tetratricopeptide repeat protein [Candidatus Krumholzibacteria bacterium]HRY41243.1 tetratricopeptide repeat protein [Candidatus Krumholzibacteria bacterium]
MNAPHRTVAVALALAVAAVAFAAPEPALYFGDQGVRHHTVTTTSPEAQRYFDQGLTLCYGFNHLEAIRSFEQAAKADPACAMAYWGIAYANGPHINNPEMSEEANGTAFAALARARELNERVTPLERSLIEALSKRYAEQRPEDLKPLNEAYAAAMREVWRAHPGDPDVGVIFAESLMNLRPWDLWTPDGQMQPGTGELIATLDAVIAMEPGHPAANHFYIHAIEASPTPEKALDAANRLRDAVPWAGHLVHMPSHIDIRLGHYGDAVAANQKGIASDVAYVSQAGREGFYTIYRAHNYHFLAYAAMFDGRREVAMQAARDMVSEIPAEVVREFPDFLESFLGVPYHVMVRFGMWEELLAEPEPAADLLATRAMWHYGRTMALSSLGRTEEGAREFAALEAAAAAVPESRTIGNNPTSEVLEIGRKLAEGELEYRRGEYERAFALLREAVRLDETLRYDEPWGWMQPVRHALGALLLEQGRIEEAEQVYREDLELHPRNGWALVGLAECLERSGRSEDATRIRGEFRDAWARADIPLQVSCLCRRGA